VGRRTFCSDGCVDKWRIKTDPGFVRTLVFRRDMGVCCLCGEDTVAFKASLKGLSTWQRDRRLESRGIPINRTDFWDADHIVAVVEGGGERDLDNYRTLCIPCHRRVTAALRKRLQEKQIADKPLPLFKEDD
jgi:5-methylcytosine-specific restriction protein A